MACHPKGWWQWQALAQGAECHGSPMALLWHWHSPEEVGLFARNLHKKELPLRDNVELDFHVVFDFHSATHDADRLHAEVALLQDDVSSVSAILLRD